MAAAAVFVCLVGLGAQAPQDDESVWKAFMTWFKGAPAVRGNPVAARNRGVPTRRVKTILFMLSALMSAFAGAISSIRVSAANPNSGTGYELDLFGRVRRQTEAAQAQVYASEQGQRGVVLTLVAGVATSYIVLRSLDRQLEIARQTKVMAPLTSNSNRICARKSPGNWQIRSTNSAIQTELM